MPKIPKIKSFKDFFKRLRKLRKSEKLKFELFETCTTIKNTEGKGKVRSYSIYWSSPSQSMWGPLDVLAKSYRKTEPILFGSMAAEALGLSEKVFRKLWNAQTEAKGHSPSLRRRMLKACGLTE